MLRGVRTAKDNSQVLLMTSPGMLRPIRKISTCWWSRIWWPVTRLRSWGYPPGWLPPIHGPSHLCWLGKPTLGARWIVQKNPCRSCLIAVARPIYALKPWISTQHEGLSTNVDCGEKIQRLSTVAGDVISRGGWFLAFGGMYCWRRDKRFFDAWNHPQPRTAFLAPIPRLKERNSRDTRASPGSLSPQPLGTVSAGQMSQGLLQLLPMWDDIY